MKENTKSRTKPKDFRTIFINESISLAKKLSSNSKLGGIFQLTTFFVCMIFLMTQIKKISTWAESHITLLGRLLFFSLTVKPIMIATVVLLYKLEKYETIEHEKVKKIAKMITKDILIFFYKEKEFIIYPLKFLVFKIFFLNQKIQAGIAESLLIRTILIFWILLDSFFSLVFVLTKVTFLRRYKPNSDFYCKLRGRFENYFLTLLPAGVALFSIGRLNYEDNFMIRNFIFGVCLALFSFVCYNYFDEHPYLNKFTENIVGQLLVNFTMYFLIYGTYAQYDSFLAFEIHIIMSPVVIISCFKLTQRQYREDYLSKGHISKLKYLKKIYVTGHKFTNEKDFIEDYGVIQKRIISRDNNKRYMSIWRLFSKLKNKQKLSKDYKVSSSKLLGYSKLNKQESSQNSHSNRHITESKSVLDTEEEEYDYQGIFKKLDSFVFDGYIEDTGRSSYSIFLKIMWMLRNDIILTKVYESLSELRRKTTTLTDAYFYEYAKTEVCHILKGIYFQRNLYFNNINLNEEKKNYKFKENFKQLIDIGIDVHYGLQYKDRISEIIHLIDEFITFNNKYLDLLENDKKKLKQMNDVIKEMYQRDKIIRRKFHEVEKRSKSNECIHLTPYFYYLYKCVNLQRSASLIFKAHKSRTLNQNRFIDHNKKFFTQENFFENMIIFLISANKSNFGVILDSYGDASYLRMKHEQLAGKHMNSLIMDSHIIPHNIACKRFMELPLTQLLGSIADSYIRIPKTDFIISVTFNRKIVPFVNNNFEFIIGTKFHQQDGNMYMLLDNKFNIDSFSVNMAYLFDKPEDYLDKKRVKISDFSEKLWVKMKTLIKTCRINSHKRSPIILEGSKDLSSMESEIRLDPEDITDMCTAVNQEYELGNFRLRFRNLENGSVVKRKFFARLKRLKYLEQDFYYYVLTLVYCDDFEWRTRKSVILGYYDESDFTVEKDSPLKIKRHVKKDEDFSDKISENVPHHALNNSVYHFIKDRNGKKQHSIEDEIKEEALLEKDKKSILVVGGRYQKRIGDKESTGHNDDSSNEKKIKKVSMKEFPKSEKKNQNNDSISDSSNSSGERNNVTEMGSENFAFRGTGSIFSTAVMHSHSKHYSFEDITEKVPSKPRIIFIVLVFILSCLNLLGFTVFLYFEIQTKNQDYLLDNKIRTSLVNYNSEIQACYSSIMRMTAFAEGFIPENYFENYYFENSTLDLSKLMEYHDFQTVKRIKKFKETLNEIRDELDFHQSYIGDLDENLFIEHQISNEVILPNKSTIVANTSFLQGYVLNFGVLVNELSVLKKESFKIDSEGLNVLYARKNLMNGFLVSFVEFRNKYDVLLDAKFEKFNTTVAYTLIFLTGLMFLFSIISFYNVTKIRNNLTEIFETMQTVTKRDLNERRTQLETVKIVLEKFKESNYYEDFMGYKEKFFLDEDNTRTKKTIIDKKYCFRLQGSISIFFLCYFFKVLLALLIFYLFNANINTSVWMGKKQAVNLKILYNKIVLLNSIKQRLILGKETQIMGKPIDNFLEDFNTQIQNSSHLIYELSEIGMEIEDEGGAAQYILKLNNVSLCNLTSALEPYPRYCTDIDDGIPGKGLVQSYIRIISYLDGIVRRIKNGDTDPAKILNEREFIELDYAFENVYYIGFVEIGNQMMKYIEIHLVSNTSSMINLVILAVFIVVLVSSFSIFLSLKNVVAQLKMSVFCFQVLSINTIIGNIVMRHEFLKIFEVGKNDF